MWACPFLDRDRPRSQLHARVQLPDWEEVEPPQPEGGLSEQQLSNAGATHEGHPQQGVLRIKGKLYVLTVTDPQL